MLIHLIAAARPNFMKIAPLYHALKREPWADPKIVHTGQHYDLNMSDVFFRDLRLPTPDIHLGVGSGSHAEQTGQVMVAYEKILLKTRPDLVIVVGDVNSTMACTIAASKISYTALNSNHVKSTSPSNPDTRSPMAEVGSQRSEIGRTVSGNPMNTSNPTNPNYPSRPIVAHLEAGLRSFDRDMPEEINRLVTDSLADILWTPSQDGDEHLTHEGILPEKIERVGNIMIDSLEMMRPAIEKLTVYKDYGFEKGMYGLVTLHRPSNVDEPSVLSNLCQSLARISTDTPLLFPVHPRTRKNLEKGGFLQTLEASEGIVLAEPINYINFMNLVFNCRFTLTDSGGLQEETTYLGIPCLTLRPNTERPITIEDGTNSLCRLDELEGFAAQIITGKWKKGTIPDLWDGKTAERVVGSIKRYFGIS